MNRRPVRNAMNESWRFRVRSLIAIAIIVVCFLGLAARLVKLQVIDHETYSTRSNDNRVKVLPVAPSRGLIYDRNGVLLADNQPAFRMQVVPEQVEDMDRMLADLQQVVALSEDDLRRFRQLVRARRAFHSLPLKFRLDETELARFAVDRHLFPGVEVVPYLTRYYPYGEALAHVLGYVGRISAADMRSLDEGQYAGTTHVGKSGLERQFESVLHGDVGHEQVEMTAQGRTLGVLERSPPKRGSDLHLTLDIELQLAAIKALGNRPGAIVALDPRSGEVVALVSNPAFDPNLFVNGISRQDYAELLQSPGKPLFNRAVQGGYEPGSTLKPFIALAGLHYKLRKPSDEIVSNGKFQLPERERIYHDWKRGGHGRVALTEAIGQSVNVYFYQLAVELGIDRIHDFLARFGFGRPTGIELNGEITGILPSRQWKRATRDEPWYLGETVISGIGQGFFVVTPLQLAFATAQLANRGTIDQLHLVSSFERDGLVTQPNWPRYDVGDDVEPQHYQAVIEGMDYVVNGARGTARAIASPRMRIAGKTGTAQVIGRADEEEEIDIDSLAAHLRHHALFTAFAPVDDPRLVVVAVAEHGGGGSHVAAPIARELIEHWLDHNQ